MNLLDWSKCYISKKTAQFPRETSPNSKKVLKPLEIMNQ